MSDPATQGVQSGHQTAVSGSHSLLLTLLAIGQMMGSFGIHVLALAIVGIGAHMDAFVAAQALPAFIAAVIGAALQSVWQSRLSISAHDPDAFRKVLAQSMGRTLLLLGGAGLVSWIFRGPWLGLLVPGLDAATSELAQRLVGPAVLAVVLNGYFASASLAMRALGRHELPDAIASAAAVITAVGVWLIVPSFGVVGAAWLLMIRAAMQVACSAVVLRRHGSLLAAPGIDRQDWRHMRPLLLGGSLYKTGPVVDRFWSSQAPAGAMGVYHIAHSAMTAAATVFDRSLCAPTMPGIARAVSAGRLDDVRRMLTGAAARILAASLAFLVAWIALRRPVETALGSLFGAGDAQAAQAWLAVLWLMPMLPAAGIGSVMVSVHYALGDTRTPAIVGSVAFVAGIAAKALAFLLLGLPGLALGTSLYYVGNVAAVVVLLRRRLAGGSQ